MLIIYDGDCPFCRAYTRLLRLQQAAGVISLLNAREPDPRIHHYVTLGYDLNEGMLVVIEDQIYAGAEAPWLPACILRSDWAGVWFCTCWAGRLFDPHHCAEQ